MNMAGSNGWFCVQFHSVFYFVYKFHTGKDLWFTLHVLSLSFNNNNNNEGFYIALKLRKYWYQSALQ